MPEPTEAECKIDPGDLEWATCRGSGAGGQHRNVTDSAVQLKHIPTGVSVRCESERSQAQNRRTALAVLVGRLQERERNEAAHATAADRRAQVGSGMRGDKRRTIRYQDEQVHDHPTNRRWRLKDYLRGNW